MTRQLVTEESTEGSEDDCESRSRSPGFGSKDEEEEGAEKEEGANEDSRQAVVFRGTSRGTRSKVEQA